MSSPSGPGEKDRRVGQAARRLARLPERPIASAEELALAIDEETEARDGLELDEAIRELLDEAARVPLVARALLDLPPLRAPDTRSILL
jgi:hypothetical protein